MSARASLLAIAAVAAPVQGMSQVASASPTADADVVEIPANMALALRHIVTPNDKEYALSLVDGDNNSVEKLPLSDKGSSKLCVRAQGKPRTLKVVGVSLHNRQVLAAIVKRDLDTHVYDVALWDRSTPNTVRVVATAKLELTGAAASDCRKF